MRRCGDEQRARCPSIKGVCPTLSAPVAERVGGENANPTLSTRLKFTFPNLNRTRRPDCFSVDLNFDS